MKNNTIKELKVQAKQDKLLQEFLLAWKRVQKSKFDATRHIRLWSFS